MCSAEAASVLAQEVVLILLVWATLGPFSPHCLSICLLLYTAAGVLCWRVQKSRLSTQGVKSKGFNGPNIGLKCHYKRLYYFQNHNKNWPNFCQNFIFIRVPSFGRKIGPNIRPKTGQRLLNCHSVFVDNRESEWVGIRVPSRARGLRATRFKVTVYPESRP